MTNPFMPLTFSSGHTMKNRFMLAPLTNQQSHENGQLSQDEYHWLTLRAQGGFGLVMTCASHVQKNGKGFPGQLGIFEDDLIPGHHQLAAAIQAEGALAVIQLHHAGMRSPKELISGDPLCPSANEKTGARALLLEEVHALRNAFIDAAVRAQKAGYNGVEIHGAHGYILAQFLSAQINHRTDEYGGDLEGRSRIIFEIVDGIRQHCGPHFLLGIRFSPERFGMDLDEIKWLSQQLIDGQLIDFLDFSLWDVDKMPQDEKYQNHPLLMHLKSIDFKNVKWTVAGKITTGLQVQKILDQGVDFVTIGTVGIIHHDFPLLVAANAQFTPLPKPIPKSHLIQEGLGPKFIAYLEKWPDFIE